jgi:hypothetical protein
MPVMGASVCGNGGYFQVYGDSAVDIAVASGTFTGDLNTTTYTLGTSAGLGSNTLKDAFLEITSGTCSGVRSCIVVNTDTSITIPFRAWRTTLGVVANNDTFRVFQPGTVINCPAAAAGAMISGCYDWTGNAEFPLSYPSGGSHRHGFYNVQFTGSQLSTRNAQISFIGVRSALTIHWFDNSRVNAYGPTNGFPWGVGADAITNKLSSYGFVDTASNILIGNKSVVCGVFCIKNQVTIGTGVAGEHDVFQQNGGRYEGGIALAGGCFESSGGGNTYTLIQAPLVLSKAAKVSFITGSSVKVVFAVTVGSCLDVSEGSLVTSGGSSGLTGGTTDAAGYGIRMRAGGGRVLLNGVFLLTGGTPGSDVKTSQLGAQPNAFFTTAGDFISDLGGAEIVARI